MPIPCESTPRRSVRTMSSAVMRAVARGIFMATSASTMNSVRRGAVTTTAGSAVAKPSPSQSPVILMPEFFSL